jgi:hypothetical protein
MIRFIATAMLTMGLAVASYSAAEAGVCKQKALLTGKTTTWSCKAGQVCCSAPILGYHGCGTNKLGGCLKM